MNPVTAYINDLKRFPKSAPYILGNEAAERFSFYGMKAILTTFLATTFFAHYSNPNASANEATHLFISAAYLFSVFGGLLADWFWGKYHTILWLSVIYCFGHLFLAIFDTQLVGFTLGLFLITLGAGGIKPCVSANVGEQFTEENKDLVSKLYDVFYFSINAGAFFSQLLIPYLKEHYGAAVAFGVPGVLMALATLIFWMGRHQYRMVQPTGEHRPLAIKLLLMLGAYVFFRAVFGYTGIGEKIIFQLTANTWLIVFFILLKALDSILYPTNVFIDVNLYALLHINKWQKGKSFMDIAKEKFPAQKVDDFKDVWRVLLIFSFIPFYWALYDQNGSEWVLQATQMDLHFMGHTWIAEQVQAVNAIFILLFVPLFSIFLYPWVQRMGIKVTPLRKIGMGFFLMITAFILIAWIQTKIDHRLAPNIGWQLLAYVILTASEVMVSVTGLEYAYTQAPASMKSTVMAFWLLTVAVGNFLVSQINGNISDHGFFSRFTGANYYWFFTGVLLFILVLYIIVTLLLKPQQKPVATPDNLPA